MFKKILSLAASAALAITALAGCSPEDVELFKASQKVPESCVITSKATFDVDLEEPFSMTANDIQFPQNYLDGINDVYKLISDYLSITEIETVEKKSGNMIEGKVTASLPDSSVTFTGWEEIDAQGMLTNLTVSIPYVLRPIMPKALAKKQYISLGNLNDVMNALFGSATMFRPAVGYAPEATDDYSLSVIGGADGPTSVYAAGASAANPAGSFALISTLLRSDSFIDGAAKVLDVKLVSESRREGANTVYTVTLNGETLKSIINGFASSLGKEELASALGMAGLDENGLAQIQQYAGIYANLLANCGMFDKGITAKYTVDPSGYVVRTETDMDMTLDMARYMDAAYDSAVDVAVIQAESYGMTSEEFYEEFNEDLANTKAQLNISGRFRIAAKQVAEVADINRTVAVNAPVFTEENTIDLVKDIADYRDYSIALMNWESDNAANDSYHEVADYAKSHPSGTPLTLRNGDTGAEVATVPITTADVYPDEDDGFMSMYFPFIDAAAVLPGISYDWNGELMGVEVRYTDVDGVDNYVLYPTEAGTDMYLTAVYGEDGISYNEDTVYSKYSYVDTYGLFYNGTFYVEYDMFNSDLGLESHFEDGKYCYSAVREFDGSYMSGNLFYELENLGGK